jgi:hypothetical protein
LSLHIISAFSMFAPFIQDYFYDAQAYG